MVRENWISLNYKARLKKTRVFDGLNFALNDFHESLEKLIYLKDNTKTNCISELKDKIEK